MKNFENLFKASSSKTTPDPDSLYYKYLNNQSFRGFYYDSEDKSYGIVLEFGKYLNGRLNLHAQVAEGNMNILEYQIQCDTFSINTIAYDKILINSSNFKSRLTLPETGSLELPEILEFSVQVLTRNSVYIRFMNADQYTSPINSYKGGLVLAREHQAEKTHIESPIIESDIYTSLRA